MTDDRTPMGTSDRDRKPEFIFYDEGDLNEYIARMCEASSGITGRQDEDRCTLTRRYGTYFSRRENEKPTS